LQAAVTALEETGLRTIRAHEKALTARFLEGLRQLPVTVYGSHETQRSVPVVSLNIPNMDPGELARRLSEEYDIETRSGLHCSPLAHKTIGTFPQGSLRFSFGADTTMEEIEVTLRALKEIAEG
jgi:selenocysteine lyase/cysteine desulfurase